MRTLLLVLIDVLNQPLAIHLYYNYVHSEGEHFGREQSAWCTPVRQGLVFNIRHRNHRHHHRSHSDRHHSVKPEELDAVPTLHLQLQVFQHGIRQRELQSSRVVVPIAAPIQVFSTCIVPPAREVSATTTTVTIQ